MELHFSKLSAAGNDFIMIDNRSGQIGAQYYQSLAQKLCDRRYAIGADGLILIEKSQSGDFKMTYLNSDGSHASMCGNGGRAIARFAYDIGAADKQMSFETDAGPVRAEILDDKKVKLELYEPKDLERNIKIEALGKSFDVDFIDTGVPHAVIFVDDIENTDIVKYGRAVRHHAVFAPAGTNVDFVEKKNDALYVRTYERGVEDETLACGTGIIASAIISVLKGAAESPVKVFARGGDELTVSFKMKTDKAYDVTLEGPSIMKSKLGIRKLNIYDVVLEGPAITAFSGAVTI
jgi:diaminopimelate epimerase